MHIILIVGDVLLSSASVWLQREYIRSRAFGEIERTSAGSENNGVIFRFLQPEAALDTASSIREMKMTQSWSLLCKKGVGLRIQGVVE